MSRSLIIFPLISQFLILILIRTYNVYLSIKCIYNKIILIHTIFGDTILLDTKLIIWLVNKCDVLCTVIICKHGNVFLNK